MSQETSSLLSRVIDTSVRLVAAHQIQSAARRTALFERLDERRLLSVVAVSLDDSAEVGATQASYFTLVADSAEYAGSIIRFENGGLIETPLPAPSPLTLTISSRNESDIAMTIGTVVQADGKVIAVSILAPEVAQSGSGGRWELLNSPQFDRLSFTRFNADGTVDNTFGDQGTKTYAAGSVSEPINGGIVTDAQGRILIPQGRGLLRFNADASIDTTFGDNGVVPLNSVFGLDVASDGKIVVVSGQKIIRLNADGSTDDTFTPYSLSTGAQPWQWASFKAVSVGADGSVYAVGEARTGNIGPGDVPMSTAFLTKLHSDGTLDTTFATDGRYELGQADRKWESFDAVDVLADGKIQVLGHFSWLKPWETRPNPDDIYIDASGTVLARFNVDGSLDQAYGQNGLVIDKTNELDNVFGMLVLDDGRVVTSTYGNEGGRILVVSADGLQRTVLNQSINFDSSNPYPYYDMTTAPPSLAPDGSIVAGVRVQGLYDASSRAAADTFWVRINLDGSGGGTNAPVMGESVTASPATPESSTPASAPNDPITIRLNLDAPAESSDAPTADPQIDATYLSIFNASSEIASLPASESAAFRLFAAERDDDLLALPQDIIS